MFFRKIKDKYNAGIPASILFVLFVPGHMFDWIFEWAWLGIQLLAVLFWFFMLRHKFKPVAGFSPTVWLLSFTLFALLGMTGSMYSSLVLGLQADIKDMQDLVRFLIFLPLALFVGSAIDSSKIDGFTRAVKLTVLFNLVTSVILLAEIPGLSSAVMYIYDDAKVQYNDGHIRIGIPFANPNFAAFFFVFSLSYFISFKKSNVFVVLSLISLFMTGSRSGMLSAVPLIILSYFYLLRHVSSSIKNIFIITILHIAPLYYIAELIEAIGDFGRVVELVEAVSLGDIRAVETASIRFDVVNDAVHYIAQSPILGIGPGRIYGLDVTDSQLIAWPLMHGIPGAILIYVFFAMIFLNVAIKSTVNDYVAGSVAICLSFFLMLGTGDFMKNYRLFFITILFAHIMKMIADGVGEEHKNLRVRRGVTRAVA